MGENQKWEVHNEGKDEVDDEEDEDEGDEDRGDEDKEDDEE